MSQHTLAGIPEHNEHDFWLGMICGTAITVALFALGYVVFFWNGF